MNRRDFLAAIPAALALPALAVAAPEVRMMSDLLDRFRWSEFTVEQGDEVYEALRRTGPLLCDRMVWSIDKRYEDCVNLSEASLFVVKPGCGHTITQVMGYSDDEVSARFGIPLASRTPIPCPS